MTDRLISPSSPPIVKPRERYTPAYCYVLASMVVFGAGCQQVEQGYWTKQGMSQSRFNAEYHRDFRECAQHGLQQGLINDGAPETDTIRARHVSAAKTGSTAFNECMHSRGYEWVTMHPLVGPNAHGSTGRQGRCPEDRVIVDPYGYPHCATADQAHPARSIDVPREVNLPTRLPEQNIPPTIASPESAPSREKIPEPSPRQQSDMPQQRRSPQAAGEAGQRRAFDESLCIQLSQASLSNPYETFLRCMNEKGWPPPGTK